MSADSFINYLQTLTDQKCKVGINIICLNPEHKDTNASMHIYEDNAHCFGCGYHLPAKKGKVTSINKNIKLNSKNKKVPDDIKEVNATIIKTSQKNIQDVKRWTDTRGYELELCSKLGIGFFNNLVLNETNKCKNKNINLEHINRVIIPYNEYYYSARSLNRDVKNKNLFPKGMSKELYILDGNDNNLYLVEGETDAIALKHIYFESTIIAFGGITASEKDVEKKLSEINPYFKKNIHLCFDNDTTGIKFTELSTAYLTNNGFDVNLVNIPKEFKDIDELHFKYRSESEKYISISKVEKNIIKTTQQNTNNDDIIWEESEIPQDKVFVQFEHNDSLNYGIYLLKKVEVKYTIGKGKDKQEILKEEKQNIPHVINSNGELHEVNSKYLDENKISFSEKPDLRQLSPFRYRYSLKQIRLFLEGKIQTVPAEIFKTIKKEYNKFLYFDSDEWYEIHTLWDMGSYTFMLFDYYPIFEMLGLKGSAKTKVMTVSRCFTFNASDEWTNPSAPILFRQTSAVRPTKYLDEAEKLYHLNPKTNLMEGDERTEVINSGFKKTGTVPRLEQVGRGFEMQSYYTYSPTMVGSINGLYGATRDRAIQHMMNKPPVGDERGSFEPNFTKYHQEIKDNLFVCMLQNYKKIIEIRDSIILNKLSNRDVNIWKPILVLAKWIDEKIFDRLYLFAQKLTGLKELETLSTDSLEYCIFRRCYEILKNNDGLLHLKDIRGNLGYNFHHIKEIQISKILDKAGFLKYKHKKNTGVCYEVTTFSLKQCLDQNYNGLSKIIENDVDGKSEENSSPSSLDEEKVKNESSQEVMIPDKKVTNSDDISNKNIIYNDISNNYYEKKVSESSPIITFSKEVVTPKLLDIKNNIINFLGNYKSGATVEELVADFSEKGFKVSFEDIQKVIGMLSVSGAVFPVGSNDSKKWKVV